MSFIGATSTTDAEYATVTTSVEEYSVDVYNELLAIVDSRELVSNTRDRLRYYFLARGVDIEESSVAVSNIFIGGAL